MNPAGPQRSSVGTPGSLASPPPSYDAAVSNPVGAAAAAQQLYGQGAGPGLGPGQGQGNAAAAAAAAAAGALYGAPAQPGVVATPPSGAMVNPQQFVAAGSTPTPMAASGQGVVVVQQQPQQQVVYAVAVQQQVQQPPAHLQNAQNPSRGQHLPGPQKMAIAQPAPQQVAHVVVPNRGFGGGPRGRLLSNPSLEEEWTDNWFDCFANITPSCFFATCCPCILVGQILELVTDSPLCWLITCCTILGNCLVPGAGSIVVMLSTCYARMKVRETFDIPAMCCLEDLCCGVFCWCCSIAQMARHIYRYPSTLEECTCDSDGIGVNMRARLERGV